ncbi:hypothetical protein N665_0362s0003 [Sinapis alba]|nr:hypothetical protein N665_0362s0003 [Sinapis alba]
MADCISLSVRMAYQSVWVDFSWTDGPVWTVLGPFKQYGWMIVSAYQYVWLIVSAYQYVWVIFHVLMGPVWTVHGPLTLILPFSTLKDDHISLTIRLIISANEFVWVDFSWPDGTIRTVLGPSRKYGWLIVSAYQLNVFVSGVSKLVKFSVIDTETQYNAILRTPWLHLMKAVPSTYHQCVKFPTKEGKIFTLNGNQRLARSMLVSDFKNKQVTFAIEPEKKLSQSKEETIQVGIDAENPDRTVGIGSKLSNDLVTKLTAFLRANKSTFAWKMANMPGIDPAVTAHRLNVDPTYKPIKQE